jgi:cysteine synthase
LEEAVSGHPVTLFALEWCEFCWSVRKFFHEMDIPHHVVALDAMALQDGDMGLRLRRALTRRTGMPTIPQIFVGGTFVGGCTDVFDAHASGDLQARLLAAGVSHRSNAVPDAYEMLPKWIHPRASVPA